MYVKIFAGILKSSIAADTLLRRFFIDLLLLADPEGYVIATKAAIAKDLGIGIEEVEWGIGRLLEPDPESGNPENDGRRIEAVEGRGYGWRILNYGFYRDVKTASELRAANARRQAEYRARKAGESNKSNSDITTVAKNNPSEEEEYSEAEEKKRERVHSPKNGSRLPDNFPDSDAVSWALHERPEIDARAEIEKFRDHWLSKPGKDGRKADWPATWRNWIRRSYAAVPIRSSPYHSTSKTMQSLEVLERIKNDARLDNGGTGDGAAKAAMPELGRPAIS